LIQNNLSPKLLNTSQDNESEDGDIEPTELMISRDKVLPIDGIEDSLDEFSAKQTARRLQKKAAR
jgi:hypothetical protein